VREEVIVRVEVRDSRLVYEGRTVRVRQDTIVLPDGEPVTREVVERDNAVAVVALNEQDQIILVSHYRHPVGGMLWELPAGMCDRHDETPEQTARRELSEETGLRAQSWTTLMDLHPSPGMSSETARVFLAQDLSSGDPTGEAHGEEAWLITQWMALGDAVNWVGSGRITNALAVAGILATSHYHELGAPGLRPPDAPWPRPTPSNSVA
jgi:ADP-ribose pyrophosphatase